jgi:phage tail sheath gpL-like
VAESNEDNNVFEQPEPVTVVPAPDWPDLTVTALEIPEDLQQSHAAAVKATLKNTGKAGAAAGLRLQVSVGEETVQTLDWPEPLTLAAGEE